MVVVIMSTLAFTVCFMIWMMFAVIGVPIKAQLGLNETQFGILVATPVLNRFPDPRPAGDVDRQVRRTHRVLHPDADHGHPDLDDHLRHEFWHFLAIACSSAWRAAPSPSHRLLRALVSQAAAGPGDGHFRRGQHRRRRHQLLAPIIVVGYGWTMVPRVYAGADAGDRDRVLVLHLQ